MDCHSDSISDGELKKLLTSWHLEHHYNHFMEQRITLTVLKILKPQHIEKLFANRPVGDQAIFEHRLAIWRQLQLLDESPTANKIPEAPAIESQRRQSKSCGSSQAVEANNEPENENHDVDERINRPPILLRIASTGAKRSVVGGLTSHIPSTPNSAVIASSSTPSSSSGGTVTTQHYNLSKILKASFDGQAILRYYEEHKVLREEHRTALINVIARYIEAHGCTLSLGQSSNLETQIVEMFPTEREEFYRTGRRGRIYNKVSNLKRVYKRMRQHTADASLDVSGPSSPESTNVIKEEEYVDEFADFHILDMRKHVQSNEERMNFWQRTQSTRFRDIEIIESLQDILDKWPEYKRTDAMEYINADFRAKFPKATKFSEIFLKNFKKLENISYLKVNTTSPSFKYMQQYKHCNTESKHLIILWVLHQLVPPFHQVVIDENGVRRKKRYTTLESQNASICIRSSLAELEEAMKLRQTATPPMMLVVGELGGDIRESYVYFEEMYLPCQTVLQAAELCMELYFLFNLAFPEESVLYYNFAQSLFLNIPTEMKHSRIYTTINEIEACEV